MMRAAHVAARTQRRFMKYCRKKDPLYMEGMRDILRYIQRVFSVLKMFCMQPDINVYPCRRTPVK